MLVLTRRPNETIRIGEGIEVRILAVHGHSVKVGIVAPRDLHILRGELKQESSPDAAGSMDGAA